jgi:MFS family permease
MTFLVNPFRLSDSLDISTVVLPLQTSATERTSDISDVKEILGENENTTKGESINSKHASHGLTIESLRLEIYQDESSSGFDSVYDRKSKVINRALKDIGMGIYQWQLFVLCGFGWYADNMWEQGVALILPQLSAEYGIDSNTIRYTTLALFVGLLIGAVGWGVGSDILGRRLAFNGSLFFTGVFGLAVGGTQTWIAGAALCSCLGIGIGGNIPVDAAVFLELIPFTNASLLTLLSVWAPLGQLVAGLIAWGLIPKFSCDSSWKSCRLTEDLQPCCSKSENMGWRYFVFTMGAMTLFLFICRFFLFHLYESPKYLLAQGRQSEAVAVVQKIAHRNGVKTWLTSDTLDDISEDATPERSPSKTHAVRQSLKTFSTSRVRPLFSQTKLGITTVLIWFIWAT